MNDQEKEEFIELLSKIKELLQEFDKCIYSLENKIDSKCENAQSGNSYNEILYQRCFRKDECLIKNCTECLYKNEGKKYYMDGM